MIYRKFLRNFVFLAILYISATSCEKFSGDQQIPAYLAVDSMYLTTDYYTQGTASQRITDAWVYVDDDFLGTFELPAKFPALKSGPHQLKIWPGIKKNGIASTRTNYVFYNPVVQSVNFTPDSTTDVGVLHTTYQTTTIFNWREDFENVSLTLDTTNRSSAYIARTVAGSPQTFEGMHSGLVTLDSDHDYFECQTHSKYTIPAAPVFLEMNFNISNSLVVGVFSYGGSSIYQTAIITLNPTNGTWKKIYIDLTTTLNAYPGVNSFRVYFSAFKDAGMSQSVIYFDNFKLVTR